MKNIFTLLFAAFIFVNMGTAQNVGQAAPNFTLEDLSNTNYKLSDNRGKVILVFMVGYNCSQCLASAPTVKSKLIDEFSDNNKFQAIVIDVWDGSKSAVQSFKNSTNLDAIFLQQGSTVASSWSTTKDRLFVIDTDGKMVFKGTSAARSDADAVKTALKNALSNLTTAVNNLDELDGFSLGQNYPNPVQNSTRIKFAIGKASNVTLSVFDITGKKVLVPVRQFYSVGIYEVSIQQDQLKKGIYFYRIETENFTSTKKMIFQ